MQKLYRRRKQEASGLCRASRPGKVFALSILQFEFPVLVFKGCNILYANEPAAPLAPGCWVPFTRGDLQESTVRLVAALHLPHLCLPVRFTFFPASCSDLPIQPHGAGSTSGFIFPTDRGFRVLGIQKTWAKIEYLGHVLSFCLGIFGDLGFEEKTVKFFYVTCSCF